VAEYDAKFHPVVHRKGILIQGHGTFSPNNEHHRFTISLGLGFRKIAAPDPMLPSSNLIRLPFLLGKYKV